MLRKSARLASAPASLPAAAIAPLPLPRKRKESPIRTTAADAAPTAATAIVVAAPPAKSRKPAANRPSTAAAAPTDAVTAAGAAPPAKARKPAVKRSKKAAAAADASAAAAAPPPPLVVQPPAHWELPPDVLRHFLLPMLAKPATIVAAALAFPGCYDVVSELPDWFASSLDGADKLAGQPFPIKRALSILATKRCELCGQGNVHGVKMVPCLLFAHDACIASHMINVYYLSADDKARLHAAKAPSITTEGYNRDGRPGYKEWTMVSYWEQRHHVVPDCVSVQGMAKWCLARCKQEGHDYRAHLQEATAKARRVLAAAAARRAGVTASKEAAKGPATSARVAKLNSVLFDTERPSIDHLTGEYGWGVVAAEGYLGAFLSVRATAPYSMKEALRRVDALIATEKTTAQKAAAAAAAFAAEQAAAAERAHKLQQLSAALMAASAGRYNYGNLDWELRQGVRHALAPHGVSADELDPDPSHIFSSAALEAAAGAVSAFLAQREERRLAAEAAERARQAAAAERLHKWQVVSTAVGLSLYALRNDTEACNVIVAALAPHGVSVDDTDPCHTLSSVALGDAASAVVTLLTQREERRLAAEAAERARQAAAAERLHKWQVVSTAVGLTLDSRRRDNEVCRVIDAALAPHGVSVDDTDPCHTLSSVALADAAAAVVTLLTQRKAAAAAAAAAAVERAHKLAVVNDALTAAGAAAVPSQYDPYGRIDVVKAALAPFGVALDDGDPAHTLSPEALAAAVTAVKALVERRLLAPRVGGRCSFPGCGNTPSSACPNSRCGTHCRIEYAQEAGMVGCNRHGLTIVRS